MLRGHPEACARWVQQHRSINRRWAARPGRGPTTPSSEARKATTSATSSGVPMRLNGLIAAERALASSVLAGTEQVGVHRARRHGVDAHLARRQFLGHRAHQAFHRRLAWRCTGRRPARHGAPCEVVSAMMAPPSATCRAASRSTLKAPTMLTSTSLRKSLVAELRQRARRHVDAGVGHHAVRRAAEVARRRRRTTCATCARRRARRPRSLWLRDRRSCRADRARS